MREAGFTTTQTLPFLQLAHPIGWWSSTMAGKNTDVSQFREADATGKGFETKYYTAAQHKGALVLPPFMEKAING